MFNTSELTRRNTQAALRQAAAVPDSEMLSTEVVGNVTKSECMFINRVLLASTAIAGNLDAVPHSCTISLEGDSPTPYFNSYQFSKLARRATKQEGAVEWPEGSRIRTPEEHVSGGEITRGECAKLSKHLISSFGTLGLLPQVCKGLSPA